jgi:hypothetical protein
MTVLSHGPTRRSVGVSPYPNDDPPPIDHGLRGYGAPPRAEHTGPSLHLCPEFPAVCWQLSHEKGPYGGNLLTDS